MICINNPYTDPYFNIAAEKYLLQHSSEGVFMMWQNEPSVIIGKHQNVRTEVNVDFADQHRIKIGRRISGGGAVYHDLGNVNLTFIESNKKPDFNKYPQLIIDFLATIGIQAQPDKRLGLTINGLKISGSAQYIYKDRTMFHASLLFSTDLFVLEKVLDSPDTDPRTYLRSVKCPVTNISEHLSGSMQIEQFKHLIMKHFSGENYLLNNQDIAEIERLKMNNNDNIRY
ncbi:lipoate--protein ligase family protein [Paludibacter sp.]|uniref:lipoate--protein ligase family protein n=1 Tax=Paludibacter sp. TaxID=1898105 RepID=UPI00135534E7|nr:lipoate--protein ligase family protein [Paludibacter sp.]MTK53896.1 lipoate--protein ligase family protein [Paludibacter sp.]